VNFMVEATGGDMPYALALARRWDGASGRWLTPTQVSNGDSASMMPVTADDGSDLLPQAGASVSADAWPNVSGPCRYAAYEKTTLVATEADPTIIGELHVARDAVGTFYYARTGSADSHISVAVSTGGWHLGGYKHISTSTTVSISVSNSGPDWAHVIDSRFLYARYKHERWTTNPVTGARVSCGTSYTKEPKLWLGNYEIGQDLSQYLHLCQTKYFSTALSYGPNGTFSRFSRRLRTWEGAASVDLGTGSLGLRAWSGASKDVGYSYAFGTGFDKHWLCGNDAYPPFATRIFAGG
jgi:hypothetical protein